jgi:hypothetical protein
MLPDPTKAPDPPSTEKERALARRRKMLRWAAAIGAVLALACEAAPPQYQTVCRAVATFAPHACGAGG